MIPDSVLGGQGSTLNGAAQLVLSSAAPAVVAPGRVDLLRVLTGLRHLAGSTEPGRVFAELAAVCVPALCDDVIVDIEEDGGHRYRIRRPGGSEPVKRSETSGRSTWGYLTSDSILDGV